MTELRADARRNRERVLEAATACFAERGADVSIDEIARRAGVGHATVFRRFPTKEALIATVVLERIRELLAAAEAALDEPDVEAAFRGFVWYVAELQAHDRCFFEGRKRCAGEEETGRLRAVAGELVARAQAVGAVREDVTVEDIGQLIGSVIGAAPAGQWRRYVEVVLDGLRPPKSDLSAARIAKTPSANVSSRAGSMPGL